MSHRPWPEGAKGLQGGSSHTNNRLLLNQYQLPEPTYVRSQSTRGQRKGRQSMWTSSPHSNQQSLPHLQGSFQYQLLLWVFSVFSSHRKLLPSQDHSTLLVKTCHFQTIARHSALMLSKIPRFASRFIRGWSKCESGSPTKIPNFKYLCSSKWPHWLNVVLLLFSHYVMSNAR